MRCYSQEAHCLHHHRKGKRLRTNNDFEQNSKLHFTSVWYNISKGDSMRKSKLIIVQNESKITIKKKPDVSNCVIFAGVFLAGILFPIIFEEMRDIPLFWVFYAICMLTNIATFASVFFGKVVVDSKKREINIYNLCRETHRFDELKELKSFFQEGDSDGGMDTHKVLFIFTNGHKSEIQTTSKEQTQELIDVLNGVIFPQK